MDRCCRTRIPGRALPASRQELAGATLAAVVALLLAWAALRDQAGEARDLGFASVAEMKQMKQRGYASMAHYRAVKALSAQFFAERCSVRGPREYERDCYGRSVSWKAVLEAVGTNGATLRVLNDDGSEPQPRFRITSRSLALGVDPTDVGKLVTFDAVIRERDDAWPEIGDAEVVSVEPVAPQLADAGAEPVPAAGEAGRHDPGFRAALQGL